ncbi:type II toxin-antitoxin system PemK/MazF family toxin [Kribbella sp. NPDC056951]|uniref:type II toxin-antitoxin system PemK/MazF family toxin n=1 Tax=Kribbella sp. NPDC056951 TaxID=3345978 RepID=UPI00363AC66D
MVDEDAPRKGEIYWVDFDPARGSEQAGHRPAVIISTSSWNRLMNVVTVAALTTRVKHGKMAVYLPVGKPLDKEGEILPFQIMSIDKRRLEDYAGCLSDEQVAELDAKLKLCWGLT